MTPSTIKMRIAAAPDGFQLWIFLFYSYLKKNIVINQANQRIANQAFAIPSYFMTY